MTWDKSSIASVIDNTIVRPGITYGEMVAFCEQAGEIGFRGVCITPRWAGVASEVLRGATTVVSPAIGLFGDTLAALEAAIRDSISQGADEFDMLAPVHLILDGNWDRFAGELSEIVEAAEGRPIKLILESNLLTDEQIIESCEICIDVGIACVKTSTGIFAGGADIDDVKLMASTVRGKIDVKASGGIRTFDQAAAFITAGATRIGSSSGVSIVNGAPSSS